MALIVTEIIGEGIVGKKSRNAVDKILVIVSYL